MNYSEAVEQAAAALVRGEDANWRLAELTWENTIQIVGAHSQTGHVSMADWCESVRQESGRRFSERTGNVYRAIWARHMQVPAYERPSWHEAYTEQNRDGHTNYSEAREIIERKTIERIETIATPEQKRDVAARLMADPEVADAIIAQPATRRAVYEALNRKEQRAEVRHETIRASDPIIQRLDKEAALLDLERVMSKAAEEIRALVAAIGTLPKRSDDAVAPHYFLRQSFVAIEDAIGGVRTLLETGTNDLDHFLHGVLGQKGDQ